MTRWFASSCQSRWRRLPEPVCSRCGQPLDPESTAGSARPGPAALQRVRSAVWFDGSVRGAIHQLKYEGWWRVADVAARSMRRLEPLEPGVVLVPVPLALQRLRRRGYNQSERIARALGALRGLSVRRICSAGCRRRRLRPPSLPRPERRTWRAPSSGSDPVGAPGPGGRCVHHRGDSRRRGARIGRGWSGARGSGYLCSRDGTDRVT